MISLIGRSPIRYFLPVLLLFDLALIFSRGTPWRGQLFWTIDWTGAAILLVGPVAAGLTAWHTRFQDRVFQGWQGVGRKPYRAVNAILVSDLVLIELVHVVAVMVALLVTLTANPFIGSTALHGLLQFCVLAGYISIGYVVGRLWDSPIAPPVLALALYLLPAMSSLPKLWVSYGGATSSLSGFGPQWWVDAGQAVVGVSLLVGALQIGFGSQSRLRLAVATLSTVVLVGALFLLATTKTERFRAVGISQVCSSGRLRVCVNDDIRFKLDEVRGILLAIDELERKLGVSPRPVSYTQVTPGSPASLQQDTNTRRYFVLSSSAFQDRDQLAFEILGQALIQPRCLEIGTTAPAWSIESLEVAANVVAYRVTGSAEPRTIPQVEGVLSLPRAEQDAWLKSVLQAANECSLRSVPRLPSSAG